MTKEKQRNLQQYKNKFMSKFKLRFSWLGHR